MKKFKFGFDFDCTIVNSIDLYTKIAKELGFPELICTDLTIYKIELCSHLSAEQVGKIISMAEEVYELEYKPYFHAVKTLVDFGLPPIVSARKKNPTLWMEKYFPGSDNFYPVGSNDKVQALMDLGIEYFFDDRLETCFELAEAGITPIVYNQPWNQANHPFETVDNWYDIGDILEAISCVDSMKRIYPKLNL